MKELVAVIGVSHDIAACTDLVTETVGFGEILLGPGAQTLFGECDDRLRWHILLSE
jgi:hypothetical protein